MVARIIIVSSLIFCYYIGVHCQNDISEEKAMSYLEHYGYMDVANSTKENMTSALKMFQKTYRLEMTGRLDAETKELMSRPRCSNRDVLLTGKEQFIPKRWRKTYLKYNFLNQTENLNFEQTEMVIDNVFKSWISILDLRIGKHNASDVDIRIRFYDTDNSEVLGFAYLPEKGDIYFAQNQPVVIKSDNDSDIVAYDFQWIALHEVGHSLGLLHSQDENSVMYPFYNDDVKNLSSEDSQRIEELYYVEDKALLCNQLINDFVLYRDENGNNIFMVGRHYWLISETGLRKGPFVKNPELPDRVDEAFSIGRSTFFFDGIFFYKYTNGSIKGPKRLISGSFPGMLTNIDAAFVYQEMFYAFKGDQFWELNVNTMSAKMNTSSKSMVQSWDGIPFGLTTATAFRHKVMFVKGRNFYFYDMVKRKVEPNMPKDLSLDFLRCYR